MIFYIIFAGRLSIRDYKRQLDLSRLGEIFVVCLCMLVNYCLLSSFLCSYLFVDLYAVHCCLVLLFVCMLLAAVSRAPLKISINLLSGFPV